MTFLVVRRILLLSCGSLHIHLLLDGKNWYDVSKFLSVFIKSSKLVYKSIKKCSVTLGKTKLESSSSISSIATASSLQGLDIFLRPDSKYSINVILRTHSKMDSNDVGYKFMRFLRSLDPTIHSKNDPRLLMTDDNQSRLTIESVKNHARDISSISSDPDTIFYNMDTSNFHLIYRAVNWSRRTPVWSDVDFFVISNNNNKGCYFHLFIVLN